MDKSNCCHDNDKKNEPESVYQSIFTTRYCRQSPLLVLFSERKRIETWRELWTHLAQAQCELALPQISSSQVQAMRNAVHDIDWMNARQRESETRHEVMAHIADFERACPPARGIIHLGATSCFVMVRSYQNVS